MATRLISGIYGIVNTVNGDRYVGSTANLGKRKASHFSQLRRNVHGNRHLQSAWNKYGEISFKFIVLEHVAKDMLLDVEQTYLDTTNTEYNIATVAWAPTLGNHLSPETRAKQSAAMKGRPVPDEKKARIRATLMGHPVSVETRAKMSAATKGKSRRPRSPEHCAKLALANRNRTHAKHSEETKAKMSASRMGHFVSTETRAKLSAAHTGRRMSDEIKSKVSAGRKGVPVSDKTREILSVAMKIWWAKRKQVEVA